MTFAWRVSYAYAKPDVQSPHPYGLACVCHTKYGYYMIDVMSLLKDRRAKAEGKVSRAIKALETARNELADLIAAERVMAEITGESVELKAAGTQGTDRDREIAKLLNVGADNATSPAELYPVYVEATGDNLNLDAFRTALWRLQKKAVQGSESNWTVKSENGRYWREAAEAITDDFEELLG